MELFLGPVEESIGKSGVLTLIEKGENAWMKKVWRHADFPIQLQC